jgi:hypothetical protein
MLGTGTRDSKHSQHVSHCLSGLRLNTVEQFSGAIGAELATNIERLGSGCDHALREHRVAVEFFRVECVVFAVMSLTLEVPVTIRAADNGARLIVNGPQSASPTIPAHPARRTLSATDPD